METELSPAAQFVRIVYNHSGHRKRGADSQFDGSQQDALELAIKAHLPFELDDMQWIQRNCRFTWHAGNSDNWGEIYYSVAVSCGNRSASRSFEKMKGRKPFIWKWEVDHHGAGRGTSGRLNDRLSVGDTFRCRGKLLTVTSFDDKNGRVICCIYKPQERDARGYSIGSLKVEQFIQSSHCLHISPFIYLLTTGPPWPTLPPATWSSPSARAVSRTPV